MIKQEVPRGSRKRFETTITDLDGVAVDPDECWVRLEKTGLYNNDTQLWHQAGKVGNTGEWGADIDIPTSWTLGDWLARFNWRIGNVWDGDEFLWTLIRKDRPWDHTPGPPLEVRE